ncbi:MAG TPA: alpha/beta hydrolase-fold protein [Verrucomicrobiae bacterium]|nr:alpha/beta hydrolase-fold protein [Verrucomicrobiae bacterium]
MMKPTLYLRCYPGAISLVLLLSTLSPCNSPAATPASAGEPLRNVTIRAQVPAGVGTVYLTGNRPELGNWNPSGLGMTGSDRERTATLHLPPGTQLEYKFTLGSWDREGLGPSGTVMPNYRLWVDTDTNITIVLSGFKKAGAENLEYIADWKGSGVFGRLVYWTNVPSKFLSATRNVEIWLPPGYDEKPNSRYDVLYLQDGQNLFDPRLASTGVDWGVDEAIMRCVRAGKIPPLMVVGIWNTDRRLREYSPWDEGTNYAKFLIEELLPQVNRAFRTRTGPEHTSVMGSSMGGLISFWLCWKHPDVFGRAGGLSTAFPWTGKIPMENSGPPLIEREIAAGAAVPRGIRFYFDYGTGTLDATLEPEQKKVDTWLRSQGLKEGEDFIVRQFPGAEHNEAAWRARLDEPLIFLFGSPAKP